MDQRAELIDVIRRVRNQWRLRLALRGAAIVLAGTIAALLLSASSLETLRFTPTAIIAFRVLAISNSKFDTKPNQAFFRPEIER